MGKHYSKVKKGMVFWFDQKSYGGGVDFREYVGSNGKTYKSHIQMNYRPYLVVSNDSGNSSSPTCNIVPITTSDDKTEIPVHVRFIFEGEPQYILCEQVRTVDTMALGKYHCTLSDEIMKKVEQAMAIQFAIRPEISLTDFDLSNTVKTLETMVEKILQNKMKQMEERSVKIPISDIEDAAIRLGEMVEDLIIDSKPKESVSGNNQLPPEWVKEEIKQTGLKPVERSKKESSAVPPVQSNKTLKSYKGLSQVEKFNQRYNIDKNSNSEKKVEEKPIDKKRKRNSWTDEKRRAYLKDFETMTPQEMMKKYGFSSIQSVFQTKYACKNALAKSSV